MIAQFGTDVIVADGWDIRKIEFKNLNAARNWTMGAGIPRISKAAMIQKIGVTRVKVLLPDFELPKARKVQPYTKFYGF